MGPPPAGGNATRIPTMIGVSAGLATLSILCTAGRIYTRFRLLRMPGLDDVVVLVSIVSILDSIRESGELIYSGHARRATWPFD